MCSGVHAPWLFGLSSLASLSWALGRGGLMPWLCSGVPPCTPCPRSPQQCPGLARGSSSSRVSDGCCWKLRCCSKRESGLGRGALV